VQWIRPIAFGVGSVLFYALMNFVVRRALIKIFGSLDGYRAFVREHAPAVARCLEGARPVSNQLSNDDRQQQRTSADDAGH
jgi:hypothetical protein